MKKGFLRWLVLILAALTPDAATYYIDYVGGNDANAGTSTGTAWKHSPYMRPFSGSYTHANGDRFIFKGGVTWPNQAFQMRIINGGTSGSPDYHGVDTSWFTGGAWARPIFDFELKSVTNYTGSTANQNGAGVLFDSQASGNNVNNIIFDGIHLKRHWGALNSSGISFGRTTILLYGAATTNIVITNCYIGDWDLPTITGPGQDSGNGGGVAFKDIGATGGRNFVLTGCELTTVNAAQQTGTGMKIFGTVTNCVIHDIVSALLGSGTIVNNFWYNTGEPATDTLAHENTLYNQSLSTISGNLMSNVHSAAIYDESGAFRTAANAHWNTNTGVGMTRIFNNTIMMNAGAFGGCVDIDLENLSTGTPAGVSNTAVIVYGNTLYRPAAAPAIIMTTQAQRPGQKLGLLWVANNQFINSAGGSSAVSLPSTSLINPLISFNNVTQSVAVATAQGFFTSGDLEPTTDAQDCYRAGSDMNVFPFNWSIDRLGVARSVPPDVGSYQYGATPPAPPRILRANSVRAGTVIVE